MSNEITREEHNHSISRIQEEVKKIHDCQLIMGQDVKIVVKFGENIHKLLYGSNGKDGFITTVTRNFAKLFERVSLHTKILVGTFFCGVFAGIIAFIIRYITNNKIP